MLACEDRTLRVLDRSFLLHNIEVDAVPTVLHLSGNEGGEAGDEILYGTADGRVGLVHIGRLVILLFLVLFFPCIKHNMNDSLSVLSHKVAVTYIMCTCSVSSFHMYSHIVPTTCS